MRSCKFSLRICLSLFLSLSLLFQTFPRTAGAASIRHQTDPRLMLALETKRRTQAEYEEWQNVLEEEPRIKVEDQDNPRERPIDRPDEQPPVRQPQDEQPADEQPPGSPVEIGPEGGAIPGEGGQVIITVPAGALETKVPISVTKTNVALNRDPQSSISAEDITLAASSEFGPSGTTFSRPVSVTMPLSAEARQKLNQGHELVIAVANGDALTQITQYRIDEQDLVHFEMDHFSTLLIFTATSLVILTVAMLAGRLVATDSPHIMIQPKHENVKKFIEGGNLNLPQTINPSGTTDLGINKSFKGTMGFLKTINGGATVVKMKNGSKVNCQDLTFLVASLLLASGDPRFKDIICVGGKASGDAGSGDHMWLEINIDGKIYAVDTINADRLLLMPASEAYDKFKLKPTFEFGYKKRRSNYVGWDGKPGPDDFSNSETPPPDQPPRQPPTPSPSHTEEPTQAQLDQAYSDGDEMGCSHQGKSTDIIKSELAEAYGNMTNPKLKEKFRQGYIKGGARCRPN